MDNFVLSIIIITCIIFWSCIFVFIYNCIINTNIYDYKSQLKKDSKSSLFPFRYFQDGNGNILPFVAVTGFFRTKEMLNKYYEYVNNNIHIFGITAYKTFPKEITDGSEGYYVNNQEFNYTKNIKNWLCCFRDPNDYGLTDENNILNISESDFYDINTNIEKNKKYDFIYICLKDGDKCPLNGWNAINRNFNLALKCFPIMIDEFGMNGLIVGRVNCNLEEKYGGKIEVVDQLDYHVLQEKMSQSKFLFVPNVYDASPRVVSESIIKNVPVLMNRNIVCGSKYINNETGEFFTDEHDIKLSLTNLVNKLDKINPQKWWQENYGTDISEKKLCTFLKDAFPNTLNDIENVKFIL